MVNDINIDDMMDAFDSKELFTPIMLECIKSEKNRPERVRTMLDYLQRRGPDAFEVFLVCLRETDHGFVASYLLQEYLRLKGVAVERCGQIPQETVPMSESPLQTIYHAQETQGGGDEEMVEVEHPAEMELGGNIPLPCMIQESVSNADDSCERISETEAPRTTESLQQSAPSNSRGYTRNFAEEYEMDSDPRGYLLIINNQNFSGVMSDRHGTDVDCDQLVSLFMKLGFGVDVKPNLTAQEILDNLEFLSQLESLQKVDSLLIAILSHGSEEVIFGVDGIPLSTFDLFQPFMSEKCPALHHKPKFFIINACRGDLEDKGAISISLRDKKIISKDTDPEKERPVMQDIIPNLQDFVIAYSTVPKHVSWRHQNDGSWFIQALAKVFAEKAAEKDVVSMLIMVNREVAKNGIQIPAPQIMLTKTWFLNPI